MIGWLYNWDRKVPEGASMPGAERPYRHCGTERFFTTPAEETQSLLRGEDEHLLRQDGVLKVTNGERILLERPFPRYRMQRYCGIPKPVRSSSTVESRAAPFILS